MLKNILNLGTTLRKEDQTQIKGGGPFFCSICIEECRSHNYTTKEEFSACFNECKQELC